MNRTLPCVFVLALLMAAGAAWAQPMAAPLVKIPTVAVMPFEDAAIEGDYGWTHCARRWGPGAGVADMITTELLNEAERWRTFRVVERDRLFEVLAEQDLAAGGRIDPATAARVGRILGADLLLTGGVTRFDVEDDWIGLPWRIGIDAERHHATVVFEGRLVDTEKAGIVGHGRGRGTDTRYGATVRRGDLAGLDFGTSHFRESMLGRASERAAHALAQEISARIDRLVGPSCEWLLEGDAIVVYVEGGTVMLNRGARDGVQAADVFAIRRKCQDIFDPLTGELLKTIYDDIGVLTVREIEEKVSSGEVVPAPDAPGEPRVGDVAVRLAET